MKSIALDGTVALKRLAIVLTVVFALGTVGIANAQPVGAATVNTSPDVTLPWPGSEANSASYWTAYFTKPGRDNVVCRKVDSGGDYITIGGGHERLVIKNDQRNFIWFNPVAGDYASDKGVSHYFVCDWDKEPDPWAPRASLNMKCINPTTVLVTYQYTTDGRRMRLDRSVTGHVFPAVEYIVNGSDTLKYRVPLGNDGKRWVKAKFVLSGHDKRIVREKGRAFDCGGKVINRGGGDLIGPKGDPWYRGVAWYKGTKRAKATLTVNGNVVFARKFGDRNPETKCVFRSGWRYILPGKRLVYTVREMGTNRVLYREVVRRTPAGFFGDLYKGFTPGVTCR